MASQQTKRSRSHAEPADDWASTAAEWQGAGLHKAELESGTRITFRLSTLSELIHAGALPEELMQLALLEYGDPGAGTKLIADTVTLPDDASEDEINNAVEQASVIGRKLAQLNYELCAAALVKPKLTAAQVAELPDGDVQMLSGFLTRQLIFDAAGRRVGVEPLDTFRVFAEEHGHDVATCEECQAARSRLATAVRG